MAQKENSEDLQNVALEDSVQYWSVHVCKESTWVQQKNYFKKLEVTLPCTHTGTEIAPIPTSQARKPQNLWGIVWSTQKGLVSVVGIN